MTYPGIRITRCQSGRVVSDTWLPVGQRPTYADDEALITALHAAWRQAGDDRLPESAAD
ncbi:hypothetical protein [Amycolatopsis alba]|uniref:hypothetical protein n=1 Tax=Amycolatopsis alba TaxID=76020 RepID=UPI00035D5D82|nr:hypothetical protein [Amycolatopsis alba]